MKQLTFVPIGGLANRIYATTSAIGFCMDNRIRMKVIWFKDWGMGAGFHDLFNLSPMVDHVEIKDANFWDFFKYAKPIKSNFFLPYLYQKFIFDSIYSWNEYSRFVPVEKWYLLRKNEQKFYLMHSWKFYDNIQLFHTFTPKKTIQKRIDAQLHRLSLHTTGVHIRRTDSAEATKHSPLTVFIKKMQQEIAINPDANFYVASDSPEEKQKLIDTFGKRIISAENILKRNTISGIVDALIELYTLSHTKKILGSFRSSYSVLASEIKGIPLEILIEDTEQIVNINA